PGLEKTSTRLKRLPGYAVVKEEACGGVRGRGSLPIPSSIHRHGQGEPSMSTKQKDKEHKGEQITVPVLPLRDVIIFPHMVVPLFVGREKSINALEECVSRKIDLFLVAQKDAATVNPSEKDIFQVGTLGTILQILRLPDNTVKV